MILSRRKLFGAVPALAAMQIPEIGNVGLWEVKLSFTDHVFDSENGELAAWESAYSWISEWWNEADGCRGYNCTISYGTSAGWTKYGSYNRNKVVWQMFDKLKWRQDATEEEIIEWRNKWPSLSFVYDREDDFRPASVIVRHMKEVEEDFKNRGYHQIPLSHRIHDGAYYSSKARFECV